MRRFNQCYTPKSSSTFTFSCPTSLLQVALRHNQARCNGELFYPLPLFFFFPPSLFRVVAFTNKSMTLFNEEV